MSKNVVKSALKFIKFYKNWYVAFLEYAGFFKLYSTKIYESRGGDKFKTRAGTNDLGVIARIFIENENKEFVNQLPESPVIIDIGSHIGIFALFVKKFRPYAKIYCFEPMPDNFNLLKENIKINRCNEIKIENVAVSDKNQKAELSFQKRFSAGCSLIKHDNHDESIVVTCKTIETIFKENDIKYCDLMKIDTEGFDYYILKSIPEKYLKKIRFIHCEFHTKNEADKIQNLLHKLFDIKVICFSGKETYGNIF